MMASQKLGIASPSVEKARAPLSIAPRGRMPERMPSGIPTISETIDEATTRPKVIGNRMAIWELTDWPVERDVPKFPWRALVSQCQYWTSSGSLRWSSARTRAISAGVALKPPANVTAGSPGTSASKKKTANETMSSTGMTLNSRLRIDLPTHTPQGACRETANCTAVACLPQAHTRPSGMNEGVTGGPSRRAPDGDARATLEPG